MRTLVLLLTLTFFSLSLPAQDTWNDYVIGRPMEGYYDAKKTVAKEWGINYQTIFAGCVLSDETLAKAKGYEKSNKAYFKTLASTYGKNWMQDFELAVKKEIHRNSPYEKGVWYEIADKNKNKAFYATKQAVAKTWGISYEVKYVSDSMNASEKAALAELFLNNNDYINQLENTFGQNWQEKLTQEVNFELKNKK